VTNTDTSIPLSVIGPGSAALSFDLGPGEKFNVTFGLNADTFNEENLSFYMNLTSDKFGGDENEPVNLTFPNINKSNYNFTISPSTWNITITNETNASQICEDTSQVFTITNTGDEPLSDLSVNLSAGIGNLSGDILIQPSIERYKLKTGESKTSLSENHL